MRALGVAASEGPCALFTRVRLYRALCYRCFCNIIAASTLGACGRVVQWSICSTERERERKRKRKNACLRASRREAISMTGLRVSFTRRALRRRNELRAREGG